MIFIILWALAWGFLGWHIGKQYGNAAGDALACALFGPLGVVVCLVILWSHERKGGAS